MSEKLLNEKALLEALFPEGNRPSGRWLRNQRKARTIPFVKWGHLVFYDLPAVRQALSDKLTVKAKR
jgi:hypothetical protein